MLCQKKLDHRPAFLLAVISMGLPCLKFQKFSLNFENYFNNDKWLSL